MNKQKYIRREGALGRLEKQLERGTKTKKGTRGEQIPLTEKDIKRINREIQTLEKRQ